MWNTLIRHSLILNIRSSSHFRKILSITFQVIKNSEPSMFSSNIDDISEVTPHLYVCGKHAITDAAIERLGITMIINSAKELENYASSSKDIYYIKIPVHDQSEALLHPYFKVLIY